MQKLPHHARFAVVLLACLSVGLHWSALQVVGWVSMAVEFSRTSTVPTALEMTFDGKHPCELCKLVQDHGMRSESEKQNPPESKSDIKLLAATIWENPLRWLAPSFLISAFPNESRQVSLDNERPPVPPPRVVFSPVNHPSIAPTAGGLRRVMMSRPFSFIQVRQAVGVATLLIHS